MIVLDTHVLIWFVNDQRRLSSKALSEIQKAKKKGEIYVSSISVWEIALLAKKGRLKFNIDTSLWIRAVNNLSFFQFIDVSPSIAYKSVNLEGIFHQDPADRIIIATAQELDAELITRDKRILKYRYVDAVW